jgi:SAM-dependent methyltransferase
MNQTIKNELRRLLPNKLIQYLRSKRAVMRTLGAARGSYPRNCPICSYEGRFIAFGFPVRLDSQCPSCGSLERHRLFKLWFDTHAGDLRNKRLLHFAPASFEESVSELIRSKAETYTTADIVPGAADIVLDLQSIDLPDQSYDFVICSHVLEHVDDKSALSELFRIVTPGGVAILMFPIIEGWERTYENCTVRTPTDRLLHFGQEDHVRYFGRDVRKRIQAAGFYLEEFTAEEPFVHRHGLIRGEKVFVAKKPKAYAV